MGLERRPSKLRATLSRLGESLRLRRRPTEQIPADPLRGRAILIEGATTAFLEPGQRTLPEVRSALLEEGDQQAIQLTSRSSRKGSGTASGDSGLAGALIREHISKRAQWLATHDPNKPSLGRALTGLAEFMPIPLGPALVAVAPEIGVPLYAALAAVPVVGWLLDAALTTYTVGDLVTGIEFVRGKTLDGRPLSILERGAYLVATIFPIIPARPFITWLDKKQEQHLDPRIRAAQQKAQK